jgi:hypothetical protein
MQKRPFIMLAIVLAIVFLSPARTEVAHARTTTITVAFQTEDDHWVSPLCCGQSGDVYADATSPVNIELEDLNGGDLNDGDIVVLRTYGLWGAAAFSVADYSGNPIHSSNANTSSPTNTEKFYIWSGECEYCQIPAGTVFLQNVATGEYWIAPDCGGGLLNGNAIDTGSSCSRFEMAFQ